MLCGMILYAFFNGILECDPVNGRKIGSFNQVGIASSIPLCSSFTVLSYASSIKSFSHSSNYVARQRVIVLNGIILYSIKEKCILVLTYYMS